MPSPARPETRSPALPSLVPAPAPRVGIFDSGVGGLSVLQAVHARLPASELLYAADTAHAPYGDRSEDDICDRSLRIASFLRAQGAELVVVACNTATAAAVAALRAAWPEMPIVGVEPGIKPAVAASTSRRIGVLATTRTLASEKFRRLALAHAEGATLHLQACPGLADAIEAADTAGTGLAAMVERYCAPLREAGVDVVVLGCTHYPFARALFEGALPGVRLVDTADAVARQTARLAAGLRPAMRDRGDGSLDRDAAPAAPPLPSPWLRAWSSGAPDVLRTFVQRRMALDISVQPMAC
jgi:glutamate racemase